MTNFKEPYYLVDFTSSVCNFEIFVNDMPVFIHYEEGSISSHYPINHFILESGTQNVRIRTLPLKGETSLRKDSSIKIKIHFYDAFDNDYSNLIEVFRFETPDLSEQEMPLLEFKGKFEAEVPYKIIGWKNSIKLIEDKSLIDKALSFCKMLHLEVKNGNFHKIGLLQSQKLKEIDESLYIDDSNNEEEWNGVVEQIKSSHMTLEEFPPNPIITFYGEGKVINITRESGNPILYFKNDEQEEFGLPILIHKETVNSDFEIIR